MIRSCGLHRFRRLALVYLHGRVDGCVFVHDKIRSTLLDRHPEQDRQWLHRLVARYLQQHEPDRAADVAYHFDAAGDSRSALPYALQAAEQARAQYAFDTADFLDSFVVTGFNLFRTIPVFTFNLLD